MIYCVEDDSSIRELVLYALQNSGFEAKGFADASELYPELLHNPPELVLLDIMLPGEDGIAILKKMKQNAQTRKVPVIMLTAKGSEYDRVLGLDLGADDYITKPFGVIEMISRVKAVLRRCAPEGAVSRTLTLGEITLDPERHRVGAAGREVALTFKEFSLLQFLMENSGRVLTRDRILETVWGYDFEGETRTVDMHIKTLRQKLGEAGALIETVRGVGYRMEGPEK
ncbi:MAG: response regulator transcription factor [Oscillospiraceae bacterium]|uniref:winged helix-turn-helix domain-containing protein n=1 Tax=Pseudoflavonifractor capillosus TaxID=106588 RepID=UPI0008EE4295|nr:response regulator transcription factor [Pseudoflavonifractor capillosus]MBS1380976.1 response regulator transcription factor [Oscillospiraceae bacterium]MCM0706313.1 response regulator transcription factor [Faecalicatena sp. BF-R-105]MDY3218466.1 response regulator transcription factor [Candidatus Fimivivens sp.]SFJ58932.1 two-component system, OmpR family, alkaline phosphatase synthesis response regulator PhoP [Ruminococcaceae bacterium D5]GKH49434.1 DNA-binding response regulator [Eubact